MGDELEQQLAGKTLDDIRHALPCSHPIQVELEQLAASQQEVEQLRVQLAGCGVAALANTHESRQQSAKQGDYGWSQSYQDVLDAIGREINLREQLDSSQREVETIRKQTAREIYGLVNTFAVPDIVFVLDAIKSRYGLEG